MEFSPSGKKVCPSTGPKRAKIVLIGESPARVEMDEGEPFVGIAGKLLNEGLRHAGIPRADVYLMNVVPVRAPQDKFAKHDSADLEWARQRFHAELATLDAKVYVPLGANPTEWLLGAKLPVAQRNGKDKSGFIGEWRGSVLPVYQLRHSAPADRPEHYLSSLNVSDIALPNDDAVILPTFHPAAITRQFTWHPWFLMDLRRAAKIANDGLPPTKYRTWHFQDPAALRELAASGVYLIALDSELDPWIVSVTTDDSVHVFQWTGEFREPLTALLTSPRILKIAHNWLHDYAFFRKCLGIAVARPYFDTQGGAHVLNTAMQKELSPHIATRYTNWAYHKWLAHVDQLLYCGMDGVVCYDAYWPQIEELTKRNLYHVADHDHKLLTPLMEMQAIGMKIDEVARLEVEQELRKQLMEDMAAVDTAVAPIVTANIKRFKKPHLFRVQRSCYCCGGGKVKRLHCPNCYFAEYGAWDGKITKALVQEQGFKTIKAFKAALRSCGACDGTGKIIKSLPFNSDSSDQIADVVYRGLKIRARKYKGSETVKAAQLDPIKDKHPVIAQIVMLSKTRADYETVERLRAGDDGAIHCVFDPFGTGSGRVASKEGLLEVGTNAQNLPKRARRFIVPRDGFVFLHPDAAQIEARAVAVLSKDQKLLAAFTAPIDWPGHPKHGTIDSHTKVVQLFNEYGVPITRDQAKRFTYAGIYGGRAEQLTKELNAEAFRKGSSERLSVEQVQLGLDTFFRVFSGVKRWQGEVLEEVLRTRKLRNPLTQREFTWLGYIYDKKTKGLKYEIAKQVWSRLPQDTAAWVLALGLIAMRYDSGLWGGLLTPVQHGHDALLIECPVDRLDEGKREATRLLTQEVFGITFPVEMKVGKNWLEASGE